MKYEVDGDVGGGGTASSESSSRVRDDDDDMRQEQDGRIEPRKIMRKFEENSAEGSKSGSIYDARESPSHAREGEESNLNAAKENLHLSTPKPANPNRAPVTLIPLLACTSSSKGTTTNGSQGPVQDQPPPLLVPSQLTSEFSI